MRIQSKPVPYNVVSAAQTVEPTGTLTSIDCKGFDTLLIYIDTGGNTTIDTLWWDDAMLKFYRAPGQQQVVAGAVSQILEIPVIGRYVALFVPSVSGTATIRVALHRRAV